MKCIFKTLMFFLGFGVLSHFTLQGKEDKAFQKRKPSAIHSVFLQEGLLDSCLQDLGIPSTSMDPDCYSGNPVRLEASWDSLALLPETTRFLFTLVDPSTQLIEAISREPVFYVRDTGDFFMYPVVFSSGTLDLVEIEPGETSLDSLRVILQAGDSCNQIGSTPATFQVADCRETCSADPGMLELQTEEDCWDGRGTTRLIAVPSAPAVVPDGYIKRYLLSSGEDMVLQAIRRYPKFRIADIGRYTIHTIVYTREQLALGEIEWGTTTLAELDAVLDSSINCFALDREGVSFEFAPCEEPCLADAGSMLAGEIGCKEDEEPLVLRAGINEFPTIPRKFKRRFLLTYGDSLLVEDVKRKPVFRVDSMGVYRIHSFVYNPRTFDRNQIEEGITTGTDILSYISEMEICASLDAEGAIFQVDSCEAPCEVDPGMLVAQPHECINDSIGTLLSAIRSSVASIPSGFQRAYLLSSQGEKIVEEIGQIPTFQVSTEGMYAIHTLIYDPLTFNPDDILFGTDRISDLLTKGDELKICLGLEEVGATFEVSICDSIPDICMADAGTLVADTIDCLSPDSSVVLSATAGMQAMVPEGYSQVFVLTQDSSLTLVSVDSLPGFEVAATGMYTIHSLVYNPSELTLPELNDSVSVTGFDLLAQIEADSLCASLDVTGASFVVEPCVQDTVPPAPPVCMADAGTLVADTVDCLSPDSSLVLSATEGMQAMVPEGYSQVFVLTQDSSLTLVSVDSLPEFGVAATGMYTIHSFVYNPSELTLPELNDSVAVTGFDLLAQIEADSLCASLDVAGASFVVEPCVQDTIPVEPPVCLADAGTLMADSVSCLSPDSSVVLSATEGMQAMVPEGYSQVFVLTQDSSLTLVSVDSLPGFEVAATGMYTIHSLVYNPSELTLPELNDSVAVTGFDLLAQIEADSLCASLDVAGASFVVEPCVQDTVPPAPPVCMADAGTLVTDTVDCLSPDSSLVLSATAGMQAMVPEGYSQVFVLTQDSSLTLLAIDSIPYFVVGSPGKYTLHSFVYNPSELALPDPNDSVVVTGFDLLAQIEADSLCASLDVAGAAFEVRECEASCVVEAPSMSALKENLCLNEGIAELQAFPEDFPKEGEEYTQVFILTSGEEERVQKVSEWPLFQVNQPGTYKVYSFIYNSRDIFLGLIEFGQLNLQELIAFVGELDPCASFSPEGASFSVEDCDCPADAGMLTAEEISCFDGINPVTLNIGLVEKPIYPRGFKLGYVLARGNAKVIQGAYRWPFINVRDTGTYSVHPIVYNPRTFDLERLDSGLSQESDDDDDEDDNEEEDDEDNDDDDSREIPERMTISILASSLAQKNICAKLEENGAVWKIEACSTVVSDQAKGFKIADSQVVNGGDLDGAVFQLSPNPSYGVAYIKGVNVDQGTHELILIDMQGRVVKKGIISSLAQPHAMDLQDLSNGFYGVQVIEPSGKIHSFKLSLQR